MPNPSERGKSTGVSGQGISGESGVIRFRARVPVTGKSGFVIGSETVELTTYGLRKQEVPDQSGIKPNCQFDPQSRDYKPK
ncbi:MAG: hypothetical protein M1524_02545 [Patescibacteria group bacterium]|nr:hypothetical protein [Patescibacteria group bacterium]